MPSGFVFDVLFFLAVLFIFSIGVGVLAIIVLYIADRTQTHHAIRRNYPVIGRMRYLLEHMGTFLRQYFFAMDREEMPFNRAQRTYVYQASKNVDTTSAFGSTRDLHAAGSVLFVNCAFPTLESDALETSSVTIGKDMCEQPYTTRSCSMFRP
ncbi:hypothetical protein JCM17844_09960 [Iodidimonas gelatinilytica]|uniref:FMN-binding glutamate synthase family protein n=1 Tax=Iodidimonas gelatinilytica TaxID=1236966 RepID=A0A5A7MW33_9PROT|nr:hypothetical protein [Iodidimonas gelatinilytica]GEQ97359.1 hypothetical protein JCM17844_09960 [Iodidimonas gelatinilytica]GEQ99684.1 hypothetical protein JCM17845_03080 [Iodidimonas gelatinilytica]